MSQGDPFTPTSLFAFPLFSFALGEAEKRREPLVREILALRAAHPGARRSNRNSWHSGDEFKAANSEHVTWVLASAMTFAKRALARYYGDWATSELRLGHYWANVSGPGGWNAPHHHFPTHWSGVYYVSVGNTVAGTGPAGHEDLAGMIEFLNPTPWQATWNRSGNFTVGPKDGTGLLFPASLLHFVHPHQVDENRISIAYNFTVVPKS